jgi:MoaA/NifB/PqqE/SkfB family radical SAM enzyme
MQNFNLGFLTGLISPSVIFPLLYMARYNRNLLKAVSPRPVDVSLKVTERCNSRCITCNVWREQSDKPELAMAELEDIFYQLRDIGIKTIGLYGGEPLLRNDIGEVAAAANRIIKDSKILVITNGLLLRKKAKELLDGGVDFVCISLDGVEEVNDKIRGVPRYYETVIEGIEELQRIDTQKKIKINIGTTLLSLNIHQVPELINLARELGISWSFNLFDTSPYHFRNVDSPGSLGKISDNMIAETIRFISEERRKDPQTMVGIDPVGLEFAREYLKGGRPLFHCILGYLRVYIDSYTNVYSGCWALPPLGNLKEDKLKNILKSPRYRKRLNDMYELKCPYCTCGYLINCLFNNPRGGIQFLLRNIALTQN